MPCWGLLSDVAGVLGVVALFCLLRAFSLSFVFQTRLSNVCNCCKLQPGVPAYCKLRVDKTRLVA